MLVNILQSVKEWVRDWSESTFLKLSGGTLTGALGGTTAAFSGKVEAGTYLQAKDNIVVGPSMTSNVVTFGSTNPKIEFQDNNASQNGQLIFTDYDTVHPGATLAWITDQAQSWFHTEHIEATNSVTFGQSINNKSVNVSNASATVSSNTLITGYYEKDASGTGVGYSEVYRTSTGVYRSFAVTNPKANISTGFYVHALDNGTRNYTSSDGESFRKGLGLANRTWTSLGSCKFNQSATSGTNKVSYDLTNYNEVLFVAKCTTAGDNASNVYGGSLLLPKAILTSTTCEYLLTGGSTSGEATGDRYFAFKGTNTYAQPIAAWSDSVNRYSTTTLYVYAR